MYGGRALKSVILTAFSGTFGALGGETHFPSNSPRSLECPEGVPAVFSGRDPGGCVSTAAPSPQNPGNPGSPSKKQEKRAGPPGSVLGGSGPRRFLHEMQMKILRFFEK